MPASSLVLSYIEGYAARDVAPFVTSLRASGYSGDVVFFTSNVEDDCQALFETYDVRQIPVGRLDMKQRIHVFPALARWFGRKPTCILPDRSVNMRLSRFFRRLKLGESAVAWTIAKHLWHCQSGRFFYFQEFLEVNPQYESILIADARDVLFQRDPFADPFKNKLYVFEEYSGTPLGRQRDNAGWIENLYGPEALAALADNPVICVGLLMGARDPLLTAIRKMTREMITNYAGWGTDQGIPNYLIRTGQLPDTVVVPYGTGPAVHLGIAPRPTIQVDEQGHILDDGGEVYPVVHQYDRHPDLTESLLAGLKSSASTSNSGRTPSFGSPVLPMKQLSPVIPSDG